MGLGAARTLILIVVLLVVLGGGCDVIDVYLSVVLGCGCDVIDVHVLVCGTPVLVCIVEPADRTLLDRAARSAVAVLARWLALVLGWGVRAEVAVAPSRDGASDVGPRREAARTRWPEAARPRSTGTCWRAAGARAAESARTRRTPRAAFFTGTRLADRQRASLEWLLVEPSNGFFRDVAIGVIDEREPAWPAGFPIDRQYDLARRPHAREVFPQFRFVGGVRQIPNEQTD